jgi:hypothetical protein
MKNLGLILVLVFVAGCKEPGMNVKMASTDAGAGVVIVGILESVSVEDFEPVKADVIKVSLDLLAFVNSGNLETLPFYIVQAKLNEFMIGKGYGDYVFIVDTALQYIKQQNVNVEVIGLNNVKLLKIALEGIIRNAERSTVEGRGKK